MRKTAFRTTVLGLFAVMLAGLYACAAHQSMSRSHPVEVTPSQLCSDCHKDWRTSLDHTADFGARHKFIAAQQKNACGICHAETFCTDCHANKEELKPSDKFKDAPERMMPHRGDYLNQHKIDGRLNPASCFPCHGRQNNERCKVCHK